MTPGDLGLEEEVLLTMRFSPGDRDYIFMIPKEAFKRLKERAAMEGTTIAELLKNITLSHLERPFRTSYPLLKKRQHCGCGFDLPIQRPPKKR